MPSAKAINAVISSSRSPPWKLSWLLSIIDGISAVAKARQHALERLRERLLEDESVLNEIARRTATADFQQLRQLRRNALKERAEHKPPRAFRELYRVLRELEDQADD